MSIEEKDIESIDKAAKKDTFGQLASDIANYLKNVKSIDVKERLRIERELKNLQLKSSPDWLFNLIILIYNKVENDSNGKQT